MGRILIIAGAAIWVAALIAAVRDARARRITRIATVIVLIAAAVAAGYFFLR